MKHVRSYAPQDDAVADQLAQLTLQTAPKLGLDFFDLPAEIRNTIYDYALDPAELSKGTLTRVCRDINEELPPAGGNSSAWPMSLVLASRQVSFETFKMLVSKVRVRIPFLSPKHLQSPRPQDLALPLYQSIRWLQISFDDFHLRNIKRLPNLVKLEIFVENLCFVDTRTIRLQGDIFHQVPSGVEINIRCQKLEHEGHEYEFFEEYSWENLDRHNQHGRFREGTWTLRRGSMLWFSHANDFAMPRNWIVDLHKLKPTLSVEDVEKMEDAFKRGKWVYPKNPRTGTGSWWIEE